MQTTHAYLTAQHRNSDPRCSPGQPRWQHLCPRQSGCSFQRPWGHTDSDMSSAICIFLILEDICLVKSSTSAHFQLSRWRQILRCARIILRRWSERGITAVWGTCWGVPVLVGICSSALCSSGWSAGPPLKRVQTCDGRWPSGDGHCWCSWRLGGWSHGPVDGNKKKKGCQCEH